MSGFVSVPVASLTEILRATLDIAEKSYAEGLVLPDEFYRVCGAVAACGNEALEYGALIDQQAHGGWPLEQQYSSPSYKEDPIDADIIFPEERCIAAPDDPLRQLLKCPGIPIWQGTFGKRKDADDDDDSDVEYCFPERCIAGYEDDSYDDYWFPNDLIWQGTFGKRNKDDDDDDYYYCTGERCVAAPNDPLMQLVKCGREYPIFEGTFGKRR